LMNDAFLFVPVRRNQNRDRSADRFFGSITVHSFCALVPTCNHAIEALAYDRVTTGLDNGSEPPTSLLAFTQCHFDLAPFNDVRGLAREDSQRPKLGLGGSMRPAQRG